MVMISMAEKITRLGIKGCEKQLKAMTLELRENADEFLNSEVTLNFEREWFKQYIGDANQ